MRYMGVDLHKNNFVVCFMKKSGAVEFAKYKIENIGLFVKRLRRTDKIGDINDFQTQKNLDAYFGIVPRIKNASNTINHGRITKRGSQVARATLIQCTLIAIKYSPYLRDFFKKLKAAKGGGKAIIATSRKLLGIMYNTLKQDWVFENFPNFVIKA